MYRILNSDNRARFLHHTQLVDDFLDAHSLPLMQSMLTEVKARVEAARPFDQQLQETIDSQRGARQAARAAAGKKRFDQELQAAGQPKQLNSKQRKRADGNSTKPTASAPNRPMGLLRTQLHLL